MQLHLSANITARQHNWPECRNGSASRTGSYAIGTHADPAVLDLLIVKARSEKVRAIQHAAFSAIRRLQDPSAFAFLQEIIGR